MSPRDRAPYLEHSATQPDGIKLNAAHNLTDAHLDLIRRALHKHRQDVGTIIRESDIRPDSLVHQGLLAEAHELDTLLLNLYHIRHK